MISFFHKREFVLPETPAEKVLNEKLKLKAEADKKFHDIKGIASKYTLDIIVDDIIKKRNKWSTT